MWASHPQILDRSTIKITLSENSQVLSFGEVFHLWQENEEFRRYFSSTIAQSEFGALFWETPPITTTTLNRLFEFVLVSAPSLLELHPDPSAFSKHFSSSPSTQIVTFENLGGDATLVVPAPFAGADYYTHLANFLRNAPEMQSNALWRSVGLALKTRLSKVPVWLSTAGMGVSWLHVRIDSRPKYYRHQPYKGVV